MPKFKVRRGDVCHNCRKPNSPSDQYCVQCGQPLFVLQNESFHWKEGLLTLVCGVMGLLAPWWMAFALSNFTQIPLSVWTFLFSLALGVGMIACAIASTVLSVFFTNIQSRPWWAQLVIYLPVLVGGVLTSLAALVAVCVIWFVGYFLNHGGSYGGPLLGGYGSQTLDQLEEQAFQRRRYGGNPDLQLEEEIRRRRGW
jgi:hypothetical protein